MQETSCTIQQVDVLRLPVISNLKATINHHTVILWQHEIFESFAVCLKILFTKKHKIKQHIISITHSQIFSLNIDIKHSTYILILLSWNKSDLNLT